MPKGVPKNGFRKTRNRINSIDNIRNVVVPFNVVPNETDEQIAERLQERFDVLDILTNSAISGDCRALIVSGPAGLGKSYTVEKALQTWDPNGINYTQVKGYVKTTGLYKLLFQHREAGKVLVFDDADSIFFDDVSLNLLKAVCDTTERRVVSYLAETSMVDEESAMPIPRSFEFNGTIVFITNYDFDSMIERGHKLAPHLSALLSRSHYIDLSMKTRRDYMIRIHQVIDQGLLKNVGLTVEQENDVVRFIKLKSDRLRELSLRIALKIGSIRRNGNNWERIATITCCKNL